MTIGFTRAPWRVAPTYAVAMLAGLSLSAQATNGYFAHGHGIQAEGIAGVGIALPQDALAAATNPAGTGLVGSRLDVGLNYFEPSRRARIEGNNLGPFGSLDGDYSGDGKRHFFIPEFGYTRVFSPTISLGVAVYGNGGMNTRYDQNPFSALGAQGRAGVNLEQLFISPSIAWRATPDHVFGVALNLAWQRFSAEGLGPFTSASTSPGDVTNRGTDTSSGVGVRLGWIGQVAPGLQLGATWSSKISGRFDKYKGLFADEGSFDIPASYGIGLSWQAARDWTVGLDYQVIEYSGVDSIANPLSRLLEGQALGSAKGPGFGWKDVRVLKLGVIHRLNQDWTLRAGYSHASQPVPANQTFLNILAPGVVRDHLTVGFTRKIDQHTQWSGFYGHAFAKTVNGNGSIPANFGGGEADVRLKENILGVAYGWSF
ncbi:long-chain fatty acid transporter [Aquabacterium soli]|uniref:Long-chain fatty acid transporter n=1 Tax=Aquabacterium soli TaxID=2493092 RepID=A0A3R8T1P8_9BURK|nr:outer membrane protein transport protein [Aquabacterium soli]RRS00928.1 long-chain fatty acid transporter [Aquabacterium soli]